MGDDALSDTRSGALPGSVAHPGAGQIPIRPHCPRTNKVERFTGTPPAERAGRPPDRPWYHNTRRRHRSLEGRPPISRRSTTC